MRGTFINLIAIFAGGFIGLLLKKGISRKIEESLMKIIGLVVALIGLNGVIGAMFTINDVGKLKDSGSILLLISMVLGTIIGEAVDIDQKLGLFGAFVDSKTKGGEFAKGFVPATLIFAIGAVAIIGALNDGLTGDSSVLIAKSTVDFITAIVLASTLGIGVCFSGIPVFLWQGTIALCAVYISPFLSPALLDSICMVGYAMIICTGLNFIVNCQIRVANLLPALLVPIFYHLIWIYLPFAI